VQDIVTQATESNSHRNRPCHDFALGSQCGIDAAQIQQANDRLRHFAKTGLRDALIIIDMKKPFPICFAATCFGLLASTIAVLGNLPGGGTGTGANVSVVDNGDGTVTMANGVVSIHVVKSGASINQINYTYNNGGGTQTQNLLANGKNGGTFYWEFGGWGGSSWAYTLVTNSGSYAEIDLLCDSATNGLVDIHFSMLRGSPGFYVTPIWSHRPQDAAMGTGEERDNIYIAPYFNWMSVNDQVQREYGLNATYMPAFYSPQENSLCTSGPLQGTYDDKYKWSAEFSSERVWGWSSVSDSAYGVTGQNVGIWHVVSSWEFYNGGPMKPDLNDAPMVNMINGGHYYFGNDSGFAAGETWTRVSGPYFIYVNNVTNTLTDPVQTSQALYADAKAQAAAEATAWPYGWMNNTNYASAAQRGTVTGQIVINDTFNPNASASNLWVGVEQQPAVTINNVYDFQLWMKPYEFWTKADANGNFVISNVIAGNNYTLYAFGPGAEGMFMSQNQNGGNPGIIYNLPATPFNVVVTGGATNSLGTVTWTPTRVGPTVFEIGYPDRRGDKFRHGDDYWVGDVGPSPTAPSPIWDKFMEFPFDFPNGLNYIVGSNRWNTDWNYVQSVYPDYNANNTVSSSTVTFNLASNPTGATASLLMGIASDDNSPVYVTVNGTLLSGGNATGTPQTSLPTSGWFPNNNISDSNIREENHGAFSDERLTFSGSLLHAGNNTINFSFRQAGGSSFSHHFMYDYIRLELTGYVPPAPASVTAYAGNNSVLLSWPTVPGATGYNILRSTTSGSGYVAITNGVTGPVCGSGPANATFVDNTAVNGTTYYYEVQSVNPVNTSANSPQSSGVTPSAGISTNAPATPTGLTVTGTNNVVTFTWNSIPGANFYTVYRGTVVNKLGYVPFYIILSDTTTSPTYTDASGTLGCTYSYYVTATGAAGTSGNSVAITAKPVPPPPASAPANVRIADVMTSSNQTPALSWSPVSGAVGYVLYRTTNSPNGPFTFPNNYVQSMTTTNYTDGTLNTNTLYSYMVVAMNAGGVSTNSVIVSTPPAAPASLNAYPGNAQIQLVWAASAGATNYIIERGNSSGGETVLTNIANTTFTDTGLINSSNYYYFVIATGTGGNSLNSPEVAAAPFSGPPAIYWINPITSSAQGWNVNSNWSNGTAFPNGVQAAAIVNSAIGANQTINLNQTITVGNLSLGAAGGAFNITNNLGALVFDNTPGQASLVELPASKGDTISSAVTLNTSLSVSNASANPLTVSGVISGTNGMVLQGPGTLTLSGNNTFSGGLSANGGTLQLNGTTSAGNNVIALNGGATLYENNVAIANTISNTGTNTWTAYNSGTSYPAAALAGSGLLYLNIIGAGVFSPGGDWSQFSGTIAWPAGNNAGCRFYGTLGCAGAVWNLGTGTGNIYNRNGGVTVSFGALTGGPGTGISGASAATATTTYSIGALNLNSTFNGRISDGGGATALVKIGTGILALTGTNAYSGGTIVSGGTLLVNNVAGSGTGSGAVAVNSGGALGGGGMISGAVNIYSGGALAPGNPLGTLTIGSNLTLAAGSTTFVQVQHSPPTNDAVKISGTLNEGGTLNVTNSGGTTLAAGDSFNLFSASAYAGSFAGLVLPPLASGLVWNTNALNTSGTLSVAAYLPPAINHLNAGTGGFIAGGSGGIPGWTYYVLTTTNLAPAQWTRVATNQFDGAGNFTFTNATTPGATQNFYRLQLE
jgi:rhamnogalacturonan endolyase